MRATAFSRSQAEHKLAPQVGLEPTTLRLRAERLIAGSRCKHKAYTREKRVLPEFGGTLGVPHHAPFGASLQKAGFHGRILQARAQHVVQRCASAKEQFLRRPGSRYGWD